MRHRIDRWKLKCAMCDGKVEPTLVPRGRSFARSSGDLDTHPGVASMSSRRSCRLFFPCAYFLVASSLVAAPPDTRPVEGLRENNPAVHALIHARIVVE